MTIEVIITLTSLLTVSITMLMSLRFYTRFGRRKGQWGWFLMMISSISLAVSEVNDAYVVFNGGDWAGLSDVFSILAEILLSVGFVRLFNFELVSEKINEQKLKADLFETKNLLSAAKQMTTSLNIEETLKTLLQRTITLTEADLAAIYLSGHSGKLTGKYIGIRRDSTQIVMSEHDLGDLTRQVLKSGRPEFVEKPQNKIDPSVKKIPGDLSLLGGFPLLEHGETLGVMFIGFDHPHSFSEGQQLLLASIADHGALALRNSILYEMVEELSLIDSLTGLANRRQFDKRLALELAKAKRYDESLALVLLDIDHFKNVNDSFGHLAGDAVLKRIAEILKENTRSSDLAARLGGDEMGLILPQTDQVSAMQLAERLRERIQHEPIFWEGKTINLACSFGIFDGKGASLPEGAAKIYRSADQALYLAKEKGRNCIVKN